MSLKKKIVWLPYDMDTAIGINNDGQMVFGYELEDIDHQAGGENVYNGQDSVVWKNIRAAFGPELAEMYRTLRAGGNFSYDAIEQAFEEHQAKWAEAIFNEDAEFKYIKPFVESSANYLYMLLGSKAEQRKWWLYNRFRYIDSKYVAGDARNDAVFLRPYAAADITVIPYADIYATVAWDATITQERATRNQSVTLECPYSSMNGNIVNIYSSSQLASIGDLSPLKVGQIDISNATRLQALKIGDSDSEYDNSNLYSLTFGANVLLKSIDARGCSGLGDTTMTGHTQTTVDISGCSIIEHVYMEGTKIQGITLPNGGVLKTLHLPDTITNLTILNQPSITSFSVEGNDYSGISTLRLENVSSAINEKAILNAIPAQSRVRLIGIYWECTDADEIDDLLDVLDTMRGLDESGNNVDTAQVSGTIHTTELTGAQIAEFESRYPYITYDADYVESTLTLKTWDGSSTVATITCYNGVPQSTIPTPPSRSNSSDGHYSYTAVGWNTSQDAQTNDPTCVQNVTADRTVYAAYSKTVRKYTVTYVRASGDGGGTLQTISNVDWGTSITAASRYTGATPTTTQGSATDYPFEGWEPASATVTGNTTFTAKFGSAVEVAEITDSWDTIIANIDNGTYSSVYKIGNYKPLDLGTEGTINMQIVAMDADELASGGYAPLTFIGMELLNTKEIMYNSTSATGVNWSTSNVRTRLSDVILPLVPYNVRTRIQTVKKYSSIYENGQILKNGLVTNDMLWIPSAQEILGGSSYETEGVSYDVIYKNQNGRIKNLNGTACGWWIRTVQNATNPKFLTITETGTTYNSQPKNVAPAICLGFCLGLEPETTD